MTALLDRARLIGGSADAEPMEQPDADVIALDADPEPGKKSRRRPPRDAGASPAPARRTQQRSGGRFASRDQVRKGIEDEINMYTKMLALTWSMTDENCSQVLSETSANIARDLAVLCARSEWIVEHFQTTSLFADIVKLFNSSLPLLRAVYAHHVAGRRRGDQEQEEHERVTVATDYSGYQPYSPFRPV